MVTSGYSGRWGLHLEMQSNDAGLSAVHLSASHSLTDGLLQSSVLD